MRPVKVLFAALPLILCLAMGCVHTTAGNGNRIPAGFAPYTQTTKIKAVSPEGVVYRVRSEDNKPFAELTFWKEALKKRMLDAGYIFLNEAPIEADAQEGYLLELTAPYGQQDYTYLVAVFVHGKKIIIAEAAGEVGDLAARRTAVLEAIQNLKF
jgi:hypothetical protein